MSQATASATFLCWRPGTEVLVIKGPFKGNVGAVVRDAHGEVAVRLRACPKPVTLRKGSCTRL